ncbi:MAG TPA: magnesium-translocating P-type ATPase, partial [Magnetospirillaceae bacterium]|nr:magnesium-translocating P-type ATPase [Magnetospirillaceae bacterium]
MQPAAVVAQLHSGADGLSDIEAGARLQLAGPNALRTRGANLLVTFGRQFRNPMLLLLAFAAALSIAFGERTDAAIILGIVALSVGLGAFNEYRSERAIEDLHSRVSHTAVVVRDGRSEQRPVAALVPGDVVVLDTGVMVPADVRLLEALGLECDEAVLTGESLPAEKTAAAITGAEHSLELPSCAFMGTLVRAGAGRGIVVRTGASTVLGSIARQLGGRPPVTAFERGLHDFSVLLVQVTALLTVTIFVLNALLHHPLFESLLFALAIAVGLTPQLLPAIVTISLSTGAQRMARRSVVVKRLVSIEDFGNIEVLFTDKTGTLTEGRIEFAGAFDTAGKPSLEVLRYGLLCNSAVTGDEGALGGNPLDRALLEAPDRARASAEGSRQLAQAPFDYDRRRMSALVEDASGKRTIIVKGAPESVLACCPDVPATLPAALDAQFAAGARVIAVATRDAAGMQGVRAADECGLTLAGLLVFTDPPKADAARSLRRLHDLNIAVKIVTGDNERVAQKVCADLGLEVRGTLTGAALDALSDEQLIAVLPGTDVFARISPEQKSRIIRAQRALGTDVGFLGDGVNDAVALHDADVGISVDSGADVAKDAADIVLLTKDLGVLADGVVEGRRIFANTIKYILMGTSSNFGNMVSTSGASLLIPFLPMLPSQILLNNLLYDVSEMTIPTDNVDEELLQRPARWDMRLIRRFMLIFGPINSLFDFAIFGVMLWLFHAGETLFRSGFFVESFVTQTLVIFAIRTRRVPFWRSRPSLPLTATTLGACAIGASLPFSPFAAFFGFSPLPVALFSVVMLLIVTVYFALVEIAKSMF